MSRGQPDIRPVNGYDVIKVSEGVFKVYDSDREHGPDFKTFAEAAEHALTLPCREPPRR